MHIKAILAETRGGYGWPRTWIELLALGIRMGKDRVQKLMQQHGIRAKGKRLFNFTTDSKHNLPIAPTLRHREFAVAQPDKVWAGDITYIATDEGWLFLAVVIDLFSRQVVGWALREDMTRDIVIDALRMAWFKRHPGQDTVSERVAQMLDELRSLNGAGTFIFSTTAGIKAIHATSLPGIFANIRAAWPAEHGTVPDFQGRDIRRSIETRLQSLGVSREVRAQLLSHGRTSGVQQKHYERYQYLAEKAQALRLLEGHLMQVFGTIDGNQFASGSH